MVENRGNFNCFRYDIFIKCAWLAAEEKVQMYQIYCEEPNGEKGYYTKSVKVEIEHLDQECITKFQLNFPDGKELTGKLEKAKEKIVLEESLFEKGNYHLIIWMENKEGKWWKAPSRNGKSRSIRRHRQTRFLSIFET